VLAHAEQVRASSPWRLLLTVLAQEKFVAEVKKKREAKASAVATSVPALFPTSRLCKGMRFLQPAAPTVVAQLRKQTTFNQLELLQRLTT
jgi:hypothetical protein